MAGNKKISDRQLDLQKYVLKTLLTATLLDYALKTELFNGNYNDLSNKPDLTSYLNQQQVETLITSSPLNAIKASTDWFDPSSPTGSIQNYSDNGILQSMVYTNTGAERTELTLNFSQDISTKSPMTVYYTDKPTPGLEADIIKPVFKRASNTQLILGIREVDGYVGKIRIEFIFI